MRVFYDQYTSRLRSTALLFFADLLAIAAVIVFASGACYRANAEEAVLVAIWAIVPRCFTRYLEWIQRPRAFRTAVALAGVFVAFNVLLIVAGWDLLWRSAPPAERMQPHTFLGIVLAWSSSYLLYFPRCYRIHDGLLASVLLLGLIERMPQPLLWVPLFFVGLCLSAAARHLVHNVFPGRQESHFNLQNARAAGFLGALGAVVAYAVFFLALYPVLNGRVEREPGERVSVSGIYNTALGSSRESARVRSGGPTADPHLRRRRPGLSDQVRLSDLRSPLSDSRVVLSAKPLAAPWRPTPATLWKARCYSRFDASATSWVEVDPPHSRRWPDSQALGVVAPFRGTRILLGVEVHLPVVDSLVAPYYVREYGPIIRNPADDQFQLNIYGDIFPLPPLAVDSIYLVEFSPQPFDLTRHPSARARGSFPNSRFLAVPSPEEVGIDLGALANEVFVGESPIISARVSELEQYFARRFLYNNQSAWAGDAQRLGPFLTEERVGDCVYFATAAALLLRATGISTRLAAGYLGGEWNAEERRILVLKSSAHTWVEVFVPGLGWIPMDPTSWVRKHPDYRSPGSAGAQELARGPRSPNSSSPPEPEEKSDAATRPRGADAGQTTSGTPGDAHPGETPSPYENRLGRAQERRAELARRSRGSLEDRIRRWRESPPPRRKPDPSRASAESPVAHVVDHTSVILGPETPKGEGSLLFRLARVGLVVLAAFVACLAALSYLRPSPPERQKPEAADPEDPPPVPLGGPALASPTFIPKDLNEQILVHYHALQLLLRRTRNHRRSHETPLEHARRVEKDHPRTGRVLAELVPTVYRALFGTDSTHESDAQSVVRACRWIRKHFS